MSMLFVLSPAMLIPREGADDDGLPPELPPGAPPTPGKDPVFTQDDVNKIVGHRQKTLRTQYESLEKNYQSLLEKTNLTENERSELQSHLEQVQTQLRTKEQQIAVDSKRASEAHQRELKGAIEDRDRYQTLFTRSTVERAIVDAATKHEAFNPTQFVSLIGDKVRVLDELDTDGNKTGRMIPVVEIDEKDAETGLYVKVRKSPEELIASMKEDIPTWGNLFKSNVARGIGEGRGAGAQGRLDPAKVSDAEYFANRDLYQKQLGIRKRRSI